MKKFIINILLLGVVAIFAQDIHMLVDSMCTYSLWTQMQEIIGYSQITDAIQIAYRNYEHFGFNVSQLPADLTFILTDPNVYYGQLGSGRYPTSITGTKPYISFPFLIGGSWGGMGAQWESGGWFSSLWDEPVDVGFGDVNAHKNIGKQLPNGNILFIGVATDPYRIIYRTWDSSLTNQLGSGIIADSSYYWGFDVNGGIACVFYYDISNDTLIYYKTTTDGITWSNEQTWSLSFTPPYPNTEIWWRQMALTDNGEPRLVFDAVNDDDTEYPYYGRIYVSHTSGIPPVQVSSSFASPDTECFYPTIATSGNYCAVLYCMPRNNEPDTLNWWDFYLVWSTDNGITWGQPINSTEDLTYHPGLQQLAKRIDTLRARVYYAYCALMSHDIDPLAAVLSGTNECPARLYLGCSPYVGIKEVKLQTVPDPLGIEVYPNPFRNKTEIRYRISDVGQGLLQEPMVLSEPEVNLAIYDVTGRMVKSFNLVTCYSLLATSVVWDGTDDSGHKLPFGVYFVRLETDEFRKTEKVILLR